MTDAKSEAFGVRLDAATLARLDAYAERHKFKRGGAAARLLAVALADAPAHNVHEGGAESGKIAAGIVLALRDPGTLRAIGEALAASLRAPTVESPPSTAPEGPDAATGQGGAPVDRRREDSPPVHGGRRIDPPPADPPDRRGPDRIGPEHAGQWFRAKGTNGRTASHRLVTVGDLGALAYACGKTAWPLEVDRAADGRRCAECGRA